MRKLQIAVIVVMCMLASCHRATREEQCLEMVKHEKRRLPRNVTKGVILDSMKYDANTNTIVYYHTMSDSVYTDEMISRGRAQLQQNLQLDIINSVSLKRLKDEGVSFKYVYMGSDVKRVRLQLEFRNEDL